MTKNCSTCQHRRGNGIFATCYASGNYISIERRYNQKCNASFNQWPPREGIFKLLYGCLESQINRRNNHE